MPQNYLQLAHFHAYFNRKHLIVEPTSYFLNRNRLRMFSSNKTLVSICKQRRDCVKVNTKIIKSCLMYSWNGHFLQVMLELNWSKKKNTWFVVLIDRDGEYFSIYFSQTFFFFLKFCLLQLNMYIWVNV